MTMDPRTLEQLEAESSDYDACVDATADIDQFCTSTDWVVPAARELMPEREPWIFRGDDGWVALMRGHHPNGWRYLEPLEAAWGLASPVVGADPETIADQLEALVQTRAADWEVMLLSGLPLRTPLHRAVVGRVSARYEVFRQGTAVRHVAHLTGGLDGFLGRRSRNFRRSLTRADASARAAGIEFVACHVGADRSGAVFDRIQAVEHRSWKGREGVGIEAGSFGEFYRHMTRRLGARGALRTWFARHQDRDVAFCFGGVVGDSYRGLQMSFDDAYRDYSLGNLCQLRQIEELCAQGFASYDLGTGLEYKHRWAEETVESDVLVVMKM